MTFQTQPSSGRHAGTQAGPEQGRLIGPEAAGVWVTTQLCLRAIVSFISAVSFTGIYYFSQVPILVSILLTFFNGCKVDF